MKKLLSIIAAIFMMAAPAQAAIYGVGNTVLLYTAPDTITTLRGIVGCEDYTWIGNANTGVISYQTNCTTTPVLTQVYPFISTSISDSTAVGRSLIQAPTASSARTAIGAGTSSFSGDYNDLINTPSSSQVQADWTQATTGAVDFVKHKPSIPATMDDLTDGSTNKGYTSTEKTKLAGIATAATANDTDVNLKNRANHTGTQAESTVTNLTTDLANRASIYVGGTLQSNAKLIVKSATVSSGTAIFYLTDNELVGGNALCPTAVYESSINLYVNDATAAYQWSEVLTNSNKTLTITMNKMTTANILTGLLGQAQANGSSVRLTVLCN